MTGPKALLLGLLFGAFRAPVQAVLDPEVVQVLDEIVKAGAAASVAYGAWKWLLRPAGAWLTAKAHAARAYAEAASKLPERIVADDSRHDEVLGILDRIAERLDDGTALLQHHAAAIERIEGHLGLPPRRQDAA